MSVNWVDTVTVDETDYNLKDSGSVRYDESQSLTNAQKETARGNVGAASAGEVDDLKSAIAQIEDALDIQYTNLINPTEVTPGHHLNAANGSLVEDSSWDTTGFVILEANKVYYFEGIYADGFYAVFDISNKEIISTPSNYITITKTTAGDNYVGYITVGNTSVYGRFSILHSRASSAYISDLYNYYVPFGVVSVVDDLETRVDVLESKTGDSIYANLINPLDVTPSNKINASNGNLSGDNNWDATGFILLKANTNYNIDKIYCNGFFAVYDVTTKNFISTPSDYVTVAPKETGNNYYGYIIVGNSDVYIRMSIQHGKVSSAYISQFFAEYKPHKIITNEEYSDLVQSGFKKALIIGDSISAYGYQSYDKWAQVLIKSGFFPVLTTNSSIHATGFVATLSGNHDDTFNVRLEAISSPESYDLVIVFGGINDFLQNVPWGTDADDYTTYFVPAVNHFFNYLTNNFLNARIIVFKPLGCSNTGTNTQGKTSVEYGNYIEEAAGNYALPVIDSKKYSGFYPWNNDFKAAWTHNNDGLHPNADYSKKFLAAFMMGKILQFKPINN